MAHNGGISQIVMWFMGYGGDFAFMNLMKQAQGWSCGDNSANIKPANHDSNGYVHTIENGGVKTVFYVPSQTERPGNYVIKWDGGGTIARNSTGTTVSGSLSSSSGTSNNRYEFSTSATQFNIGVTAVASPGGGAGNYPTNIRVCHVDDEAALDAGDVFLPLLKSRLSKVGVIRFLDWQLANTSTLRTWEDQLTEDHFSYNAPKWPSTLYKGFTTNSGDSYSMTYGLGGPTDGEQIIITFNATSSGYAPTFNKNATGAKIIKHSNGGTIAFDVWKPTIGRTAVLTYNAALGVWLKQGGDTEDFDSGIKGVPISLALRFCKEIGAHPWFHIPYLSVDPMTNFTSSLATAVKAYSDANATWMIPRYEPMNEIWNNAAGFPGTRLGWALEASHKATVWKNYWLTATAYSVGDGVFNGEGFICARAHTSSSTVVPGGGPAWVTATSYALNDGVFINGQNYICISAHTSGTFATDLAANKWAATWTVQQDPHEWYGRAVAKVGKAVSTVYSDDRNKYQVICGVQAAGDSTASAPRLTSARYVAETGNAADAAKFWASVVSPASYWHVFKAGKADWVTSTAYFVGDGAVVSGITYRCLSNHTSGTFATDLADNKWVSHGRSEGAMATEYASATAARKIEIQIEYLSDMYTFNSTLTRCAAWATWAATYSLVMAPYEGGYDYGHDEGSGDLQAFTRSIYFAPELKRLTHVQYQYIRSIGQFPSLYTITGASDWGYGGLGESVYQAVPSTQWDGIVEYNLGRRIYRLTTS